MDPSLNLFPSVTSREINETVFGIEYKRILSFTSAVRFSSESRTSLSRSASSSLKHSFLSLTSVPGRAVASSGWR